MNDNSMTPVVILCGGYGTRIRGINEDLPKPMLQIGSRPILWHIMKYYSQFGYKNFYLCLGYQSWKIKEYFLNYSNMKCDITVHTGKDSTVEYHPSDIEDWHINLVETGIDSMTGHRLWRLREKLEGYSHFHLTYGDGLSNVNLAQLEQEHCESNRLATLTGVQVSGRFGELSITDNTINSFEEKPAKTEGYINGGYMMFTNNDLMWSHFNEKVDLVLEQEPLTSLADNGHLGVFKHHGDWQCMDTFREYTMLNNLWKNKEAFWWKS